MATTTEWIDYTERGSAPSTPASTHWRVFFKSDGLYVVDDAGTVSGPVPFTALSNPMTTAGDVIVGGASGAATRLALGPAGGFLGRINGAITNVTAGTSFPGSAASGDRFFRTDLGMEFYYDGTRWLSMQVLQMQSVPYLAGTDPGKTGDLVSSLNATTASGGGRLAVPSILGGSNLWLVSYTVVFVVGGGGSALSGSHKWVGTLVGVDTNSASTGTAATTTIDSGSSGVFRTSTVAIGAALASGTLFFLSTWTKTGTPGTLVTGEVLAYRIIAT